LSAATLSETPRQTATAAIHGILIIELQGAETFNFIQNQLELPLNVQKTLLVQMRF
jgi:hypothetical protein